MWTRVCGALLVMLSLMSVVPSFSQEQKPREVSSRNVLNQLDVLIIVDKTLGKPETETFSLIKSVVLLNELQTQYVELASSPSGSLAAAYSKDNSDFRELRANICKQRPHLTQLVELDGNLKSCEPQ